MTDLSVNDVQSRTVAAFFDTREAAQKAVDDLVSEGIPREHIRLKEGAESNTAGSVATDTNHRGFWDGLKDLFLPDEDRYGYAEGLRRGGHLLTVQVEEAYYTRVLDILDTDGAVDMNEREADWRSSGWSGYDAGSGSIGDHAMGDLTSDRTTPASDMSLAAGATANTTSMKTPAAPIPSASMPTAAAVDTLQAGRDEVIPIYEESARVGKRDVDHGRVRLRSYTVETPVNEQVNLRNEQIQLERRPVDRPVSATDLAFKDRTIEAKEHREEAFISKDARVKEEISLRKTVDNQTQSISDTVRRTEVEIEDDRANKAVGSTATFVAATDASRIAAHMDVIASDGTKIGTVDHLDGPDQIKLAKNTAPDGQHHYVPLTWVDHVDTHVHLNKTSVAAKAGW